ncbi:glycosyltransferase family 4 protein [Picrophilus oshimae]|uniref:Lipopolysaccharide N-acetylglucosaminyltransferase n=1 Tax=Picrophilus torridus (strain ATCC 700027 / DSM 9790 / JCM 10055 / NBRC 100828 / KAW 2/3) TaxID=1122961 RepID=Q6L2B4_PICTO|nr:glycosyltransferase [Picrophilus oshimae]AAT42888.1 lipopolysaccharide N-acetylglucosaminyltransferase [Picrophilus oshimae DSM 9789]
MVKTIGILGPDLFLSSGGAINHSINVMFDLKNDFKFIFFPNPYFINKYRKNKKIVNDKIIMLSKFQITVPEIFIKALNNKISWKEIINKYLNIHVDALFNFDYHFRIEIPDFSTIMSKRTGLKLGICLQGISSYSIKFSSFLNRSIKLLIVSGNPMILIFSFYQYINLIRIIKRINKNKNIKIILTVNNEYYRNINIKNKEVKILYPGNGFINPNINNSNIKSDFQLCNVKKENKIIFFARQSYIKGIFDLKPILKTMLKNNDFKFIIIGRFEHGFEEILFKRIFSDYIKNGRIKYNGYVNDNELYREIASSKVMIYPSHSDTYSIAILQALALKTMVVAYDIPGLSIYKNINAVRLVNEFDYNKMAHEALSMIKIDNIENVFDENTMKFIEEHNWHNVANQYKKYFNSI